MELNLSQETMDVVMNSLYASKQSLKSQMREQTEKGNHNKAYIIKHQLDDVENVIRIFEEYGF